MYIVKFFLLSGRAQDCSFQMTSLLHSQSGRAIRGYGVYRTSIPDYSFRLRSMTNLERLRRPYYPSRRSKKISIGATSSPSRVIYLPKFLGFSKKAFSSALYASSVQSFLQVNLYSSERASITLIFSQGKLSH